MVEDKLKKIKLVLLDVDGVLTAYTMTEPYFMLGTVVAEYLGIKPRYCASVAVGGGSPASRPDR